MSLSSTTIQTIQKLTREVFDHLVIIRHQLHQHPERSGQEAWTATYLADKLERLGLHVRIGVGGHGLVADLTSDPSAPTVALRVDMDALPIHEISKELYRSKIPGVMHACGHDVHSAIGIGTAAVLTGMGSSLPGNVRFIFQPEEEEITGALRMIRAGVLTNPTPIAIFGLHVAPIPVGKIAWTDDLFLAGFEHYLGSLSAQEGFNHPLSRLDDVAQRCCQVIQSFNNWHLPVTWDQMQAFWQKMQAGPQDLRNFIVYDASMDHENPAAWHGQFGIGVKAANRHLRIAALGRIRASLNTLCRATLTHYHIEPMGAMLDMRNDAHLVRSTLPSLKQAIGSQNTHQLKAAFPFNCEDFAYYTKYVPGAMYWLGAADPTRNKFAMLHMPDFDVDERCLETGTIAMATLLTAHLTQSR